MSFTCSGQGGICFRTANPLAGAVFATIPTLLDPLKLPIQLTAPVGLGPKARNYPHEVTAIQRGLNALYLADRGTNERLAVDGLCGPKTRRVIHQFQVRQFGPAQADTLIEPGRQTLARLNELLATRPVVAATLEDYAARLGLPVESLRLALEQSFSLARDWIRAGYYRTTAPHGDPLVRKYFQLPGQSAPDRALDQVRRIFARLHHFFQRPGGIWGEAVFEPEPVFRWNGDRAWTTPGGYLLPGQTAVATHPTGAQFTIRLDTVYYTGRFLMETSECRAFVIVHELCHLVGGIGEITDSHGYAHRPPGIEQLTPAQRLTTTDCYAMLAFEAGTGRDVSPMRA